MLRFDFYSPEEELLLPHYQEKGVRVFVKRDDLIHPYISGNKWRKLKHPLQQAQQQGKSRIVTFGGAWSNHLLATACAGARFGMHTVGFVRGEPVSNPVLQLCAIFGMELRYTEREQYQDKKHLFEEHFGDDGQAYFIDEGGYGPLAASGCAEIIAELTQPYDHIFCACGTGTTAAGLLQGMQQANYKAQLHAVPVLKGGDFIRQEIEKLGVLAYESLHLHTEYHFGGYAKTKPELISFVKDFTQRTGILIEPTYTGKLFFALHDLLDKGRFAPGDSILLLHTGGLTGLLGMLDKF